MAAKKAKTKAKPKAPGTRKRRGVKLEPTELEAKEQELDLDLPDQGPVLVRGIVRDRDRRPMPSVSVIAAGGPEPTSTETGPDGRFTLEAHAGDTIVAAGAGGYTTVELDRHGASTRDLELTLEAPVNDEPHFDEE